MGVRYVKGNLFDTDADVIAHGVNCKGKFASGVAKAVAEKYPRARNAYLEKFDEEGWSLGDVQYSHQADGKIIANCATQNNYGYKGELNADYNAIRKCMERLRSYIDTHEYSVAIPKIGAGLAGGDWNKIAPILDEVFKDSLITVYYLET